MLQGTEYQLLHVQVKCAGFCSRFFFFYSNIFLEVDQANNIKLFQIFPPEKAKVNVKRGTVNAYRYLIHGVLDPEWPPRNRK